MKNYKVYSFDIDGTLVEAFTANPLPGVVGQVNALPVDVIYLLTNQAGPTMRSIKTAGGQVYNKHHVELLDRLVDVSNLFDKEVHVYAALACPPWIHPAKRKKDKVWVEPDIQMPDKPELKNIHFLGKREFRKPRGGMFRHVPGWVEEMVYVGDRDTDEKAAAVKGCDFIYAKDFFGWDAS